MKTAITSPSIVLMLINLCGLAVIDHSFASTIPSTGQRSQDAANIQHGDQAVPSLHARIEIVSQQIATLQVRIAAIETAHNARVEQLQRILENPQPPEKTHTVKGFALSGHSVGFRQTPIGATLSVNGASVTLAPASLSIEGVQQIVLQAATIHLKSSLLQFNEGNRPLAGLGDVVAGVLAHGPMGIPIPNQYLTGHIVTGSTTVLVP